MSQSRGRARFGILVPYTNTNLEPDMGLLRPAGVSLHFARMGGYNARGFPDENQMQGFGSADLDGPLTMLMGARPDVILYGCTSATLTHGPEFDRALAARIKERSGAETVTAAGSIAKALKALGMTRIGFASPYVSAINNLAISFLADMGFETVRRSEAPEPLDNIAQGSLLPDEVFELGRNADHPEAEGLVLSCTDMRSVETISRLEAAIGKPVVSSNQAMMFEALLNLGFREPINGFGALLEEAR